MTGTVKKIVADKGFGFISSGGEDYFVHRSDVLGQFEDLHQGDEVEFQSSRTEKGLRAVAVRGA